MLLVGRNTKALFSLLVSQPTLLTCQPRALPDGRDPVSSANHNQAFLLEASLVKQAEMKGVR
jgi:hypothetical protein